MISLFSANSRKCSMPIALFCNHQNSFYSFFPRTGIAFFWLINTFNPKRFTPTSQMRYMYIQIVFTHRFSLFIDVALFLFIARFRILNRSGCSFGSWTYSTRTSMATALNVTWRVKTRRLCLTCRVRSGSRLPRCSGKVWWVYILV